MSYGPSIPRRCGVACYNAGSCSTSLERSCVLIRHALLIVLVAIALVGCAGPLPPNIPTPPESRQPTVGNLSPTTGAPTAVALASTTLPTAIPPTRAPTTPPTAVPPTQAPTAPP